MAKRLDYGDALRILGKNDSEVLDLAEKLADGGLGLVGVPDLFGARGALVSKGRKVLEGLGGKLRGESRLSRTEKIEAAFEVLAVTAFFEAAEKAFEQVGMPFALKDLEFTAEEQYSVFAGSLASRFTGFENPTFRFTHSEQHGNLATNYTSTVLTAAFLDFLLGLAVAEEHGMTSLDHPFLERLHQALEPLAAQEITATERRLAADIPEFGMWLHIGEHTKTRQEIGTGLAGLHEQLSRMSSGRTVTRRRQELAASYKAVLGRPVLRSDDVPAGLTLPPLRDAYVPPRGRVSLVSDAGDSPARDDWWERHPIQDDLQPFVATLLTHPTATRNPAVILGHPGAGKSKFTEMLAAQLPPEDFLPIRVELRAVSPNAPLHVQIEEGLAADLHTSVSWRDLSDDADGALPVIILDGFDELLQATGVDRSDYLERVQEFQEKQSNLGQPVAVIVTSRTLVADRTRFPADTVVMRLEPFDDGQVEQMLQVWNRANSSAFTTSGLNPLTPEVVLRYRDLAEQPLLLLMLLIYDTHDNALLNASETLSHGELYERLLTMFARREVDKHRPNLGGADLDRAIEDELRRLEVAAMAMFARGRQSVRADELDRDLAVLMPEAAESPDNADLHGQIAPAHQVLGRFFFVHEARSQTTDGTSSAFEFLHATFGEYLVARMVVAALEELAEDRARASRRRNRAFHLDDGELYALASFAAYAGRDKVVAFLDEFLERRFAEDPDLREDFEELLLELFREAPFPAANRSFVEYEPQRLTVSSREASYTANLITLLILVREESLPVEALFPDSTDPWHTWRRTVSMWRALSAAQWFGILDLIRMRHVGYWKREGSYSVLTRDRGEPVNVGECVGFELRSDIQGDPATLNPYEVTVPFGTVTARLLRSTAMRANGTASRLALVLTPYLRYVSDDLGTWYEDVDGDSWVEAHEVLRLRLEPIDQLCDEQLFQRLKSYERLLATTSLGRIEKVVLRQAVEDLSLWPVGTEGKNWLKQFVTDYLRGCQGLVEGPQVDREAVHLLLESLERHTGIPASKLLGKWDSEEQARRRVPDSDPSVPFRSTHLSESPGGSAGA